MKLLLDQGLPRSTVEHLRTIGADPVHVGEMGLATADDLAILGHARAEGRVVVTLDADFHMHMALSGATQPSVIPIRIEGLKGPELAVLLHDVLQRCKDALTEGALVSVLEGGVRLRRLPLNP